MNKIIMVALVFLYSSACKENVNEKKSEPVQTESRKSQEQIQPAENPDISEVRNVLVEDPKIITDGEHTQFYKSGKVKAKGYYKNGVRDSHWTVFYESGILWSEAEYKNGKRNGKATVYYPNGQKRYEGVYKDDKRTGSWKYYDQNGNFLREEQVQ